MVGGREEASACRARKLFPWQRGGGSQLIRGMSSQQGLPRPESWGSPRSFGPGARSFGSGRKGLTAVPLRVSPALQSLSFRSTTPARSRTLTATPPPACTRTHDRVGLHARSELLRVSRHERRTRPRNAGWSPPRGESQTATVVRMSIPPLSWLSGVTLTPPSTYKVTNNSDPQCHGHRIHLLHCSRNPCSVKPFEHGQGHTVTQPLKPGS